MRKMITLTAIACCSLTTLAQAEGTLGQRATSNIINNAGETIGTALYRQGNEGVLIEINVSKLPAGKHGMHLHEVGTCEDTSKFKMAKGHIMPTGRPHGFLNPEGPHEGNLPNLIVSENGTAHVELYTELVSLHGGDGVPAILDQNGSALIIHANEDDHNTQPIGGAGGRIACGVPKAAS